MIKRRFYKRGHGDDTSDSSSSSSDSDSDSIHEVEDAEEDEVEEEEVRREEDEDDDDDDEDLEIERAKSVKKKKKKKKKKSKRNKRSLSPGSGYQSEDSSVNEVDVDSSGLPASEVDSDEKGGKQFINNSNLKEAGAFQFGNGALSSDEPVQSDLADCILKCKSVFKCKLCPRIVCLNEHTAKAHLNSKRHARSKKLREEGRLKLMLNSDGEIEEDQETHAERHTRIVAVAQEPVAPSKKDRGRQRQSLRRKNRMQKGSNKEKSEVKIKNPVKKRRKIRD